MNLTPETNERSDFALEWVREAEPFRNATDAPATSTAPVLLADATRAKHKLTRVVQMLVGLRRS